MIKKFNTVIVAITLALFTSSCSNSLTAPPITAQENSNSVEGQVVWHDLLTTKVEESKIFYSNLFGWEFDTYKLNSSYEYVMIYKWGRPIGGIVDISKFENSNNITQWITAFSVKNMDKAIETSKKLGTKIYGEPLKLEGRGIMALAADNQGAAFSLIQSTTGLPDPKMPQNGDWLWNEYWTNDIAKATSYYRSLLGYDVDMLKIKGNGYNVLKSDGRSRVGVTMIPNEKIKNAWFNYVYVTDINEVVSKVEKFGGKVLLEPHQNQTGSMVALVTDPGGAAFLIRTVTPDELKEIKKNINK